MSTSGPAGPPGPIGRPGAPAARGPARRLLPVLLLALPLLELVVLLQVGSRIGVGVTLLLLLAAAIAGVLVLRHVGNSAVRRVVAAANREPEPGPGRPGGETVLLVVAGLLLVVPGFLSDLAALALLVPGVRRFVARRTGEAVLRRFPVRAVRVVPGQVLRDDASAGPGSPTDRPAPRIIDAEGRPLPPASS